MTLQEHIRRTGSASFVVAKHGGEGDIGPEGHVVAYDAMAAATYGAILLEPLVLPLDTADGTTCYCASAWIPDVTGGRYHVMI